MRNFDPFGPSRGSVVGVSRKEDNALGNKDWNKENLYPEVRFTTAVVDSAKSGKSCFQLHPVASSSVARIDCQSLKPSVKSHGSSENMQIFSSESPASLTSPTALLIKDGCTKITLGSKSRNW